MFNIALATKSSPELLTTVFLGTIKLKLTYKECLKLHENFGWWRSTVVERRSLAGELSLSCARPAADG